MIYLGYWIMLGIIGWLVLWFDLLWTRGPPPNLTYKAALRGYLFSLLLGPLTLVLFAYSLYRRIRYD